MPLLDVSFLSIDADLADTFTVTRRPYTFDHGRVVLGAPVVYNNVVGVVQFAGSNDLKRFPEGQITGKVIEIVTTFRLQGSAKVNGVQYQPDVITWHGSDFTIINVDDVANYGGGLIEALAESKVMADPAPLGSPP